MSQGEASIWNPRTIAEINSNTSIIEELLTASAGQSLFTISSFAYALGAGSLEIHRNGLLLIKGVDWTEGTTTTFSLTVASAAGDKIVATGHVGVTAVVDVRDTDIFLANYQAIRDYAGTEVTVYSQGRATLADGGENFFQKLTGAAPGTYVDNNGSVLVPTGGDGSVGWRRENSLLVVGLNNLAEATTASMTANTDRSYTVGDVITTAEFATGYGTSGGGTYDVVLTSSVTPNIYDIIIGVADATISFKLRVGLGFSANQIGFNGDGTTDMAATLNRAILIAAENSIGKVTYTAGEYLFLSAINCTRAISLVGPQPPSTAVNAESVKQTAFFVHAFNGDFITYDGSGVTGVITGSGAEIRNTAILNKFGAANSANGRAIVVDGTNAAERTTWLRLVDLEIARYSSSYGEWTWCIDIDGSTVTTANGGIRDIYLSRVRMASDTGASGSVRIRTAFNIFMDDLQCNLAKGDIFVSGASAAEKSSAIYGSSLNLAGTFSVDYADNINVSGGRASKVLTTVNTGTNVNLDFASINSSPALTNNGNINSFINALGSYLARINNVLAHMFGRDENAGDSTTSTSVGVGNTGVDQGKLSLQYTNADPTTGSQKSKLELKGRNVADTAEVNMASVRFNQVATNDWAEIEMWTGTDRKIFLQGQGSDRIDFKAALLPSIGSAYNLGAGGNEWNRIYNNAMYLTDGITQPATASGKAILFVDTADGDLKIKFGDGVVKTIVTDV